MLKTLLIFAALAALMVRGCAIESDWQDERDARQECRLTLGAAECN